MARQFPYQDETVTIGSLTIAEPSAAAAAALEGALEFCADKMRLTGPQSALDQLRSGDANAHGYFQYALAGQLAAHLGAFDGEVQAVYLYDAEATPEDTAFNPPQPASLLHLIVHARRKTEALNSLLASLDRALSQEYAERAGLPEVQHMLDAQTVDDADVQRGKGYGALLNSVHHRPVKAWQR